MVYDLQVEHNGQQEHKAGDCEVDPLHVFKRPLVVSNMVEDSVRSNDRRNDRSYACSQLSVFASKIKNCLPRSHSPLKACEKLILISEYFGGPQTVMYGLAAVSKLPKPLPMMKIAAQKPPNDLYKMQGHATSDPMPYKQRPQMKVAL